jgi:hypothetical protein
MFSAATAILGLSSAAMIKRDQAFATITLNEHHWATSSVRQKTLGRRRIETE